MNVIRAFIAIDIAPELQGKLKDASTLLKDRLQGLPVRLVQVKNIHLTVKFLGDVSISNIQVLQDSLGVEASSYHPFEIKVGGLGAFPSFRRPRVGGNKIAVETDKKKYNLFYIMML